MSKKVCYICGKSGATSKDHIPPRSIFPNVVKGQLKTVYAHSKCNSDYSKDDDLFKNQIILAATSSSSRALEEWKTRIVPSFRKDPGAKSQLQSRRGTINTINSAGIIKTLPITLIDGDLVNRQISRWTKGLFYKKFKEFIPNDLHISVSKLQHPSITLPQFHKELLDQGVRPLWIDVEPGVFSYCQMTAIDNKNIGFILYLFYNAELYLCDIDTEQFE